jgi:N-acetylmuramoyl-L-alanine amidase
MADCISNPCSSPSLTRTTHSLCAYRGAGWQGAAALLAAGVCLAASAADPASAKVKNVRFWSLGDVTRVAIEVSADFKYRQDRLPDPDRIFFDIPARPETSDRKIVVIPVGDSLLKQIR